MPRPPSRGAAGDPYGWRIHPVTGVRKFHFGDDTLGEGNFAPVSGTVTYAGWHGPSGFGYAVSIREDGHPEKPVWTVAHHARVDVAVGQKTVEGSTYLGPKGTSGTSTGPHAHTERRTGSNGTPLSGTPSNPRSYYTTTAGGGYAGFTPQEDDMFRTWYLALTPAGNWGAFWFTYTFGAIPLTTSELEAIKRENLLSAGGVQVYNDTVALSNLVRRAAAWLVEQIDNAVDDEGILAAVKAVDVNPEFQIPADLVAQITEAVPSVPEIAQGVRDELIAPDA